MNLTIVFLTVFCSLNVFHFTGVEYIGTISSALLLALFHSSIMVNAAVNRVMEDVQDIAGIPVTIPDAWCENNKLNISLCRAKLNADGISRANKISPRHISHQNSLWRAQLNEDIYAYNNFFWRKHNGLVLESGAFDGLTYSSTYALTKEFGWKAIHIEASVKNYQQLTHNRPGDIIVKYDINHIFHQTLFKFFDIDDININSALCSHDRTVHYSKWKKFAKSPAAEGPPQIIFIAAVSIYVIVF